MSRFLERLASGAPIVADGGMGALLASAVVAAALPRGGEPRAPESVIDVHLGYIRAGAELIETNTFGANRPKLAQHFLEDEFERINSAAVEARARGARGLGPRRLHRRLDRAARRRRAARARAGALYAEQAGVLEGRGVDLFMVETFFDLDDLETAIAARPLRVEPADRRAHDASTAAARRSRGVSAASGGRAAARARRSPRSVRITAPARRRRCARSPRCRATATLLAVLPNVGLASMSGQRIVFPHATPEYFGEFAAQARALGARIIGGCCGTTPAQIAAIRAAIDENLDAVAAPLLVRERELACTRRRRATRRRSSQRLLDDGTFVVSVQLDPPLGANPEALIATARAVRESGKAQFVDVNDNPRARARMSGIMASVAIERFTGVETIPHLTPRDTTVAGLESLLLGAHAEGVRNILAVTGDPPESGDYPGTHDGATTSTRSGSSS